LFYSYISHLLYCSLYNLRNFFLSAKMCVCIYKSVQVVLIFVYPSVHIIYVRLWYRNMLEILEYDNPIPGHTGIPITKSIYGLIPPLYKNPDIILLAQKWNGSSNSLSKYLSHIQQKKIASSNTFCPLKSSFENTILFVIPNAPCEGSPPNPPSVLDYS